MLQLGSCDLRDIAVTGDGYMTTGEWSVNAKA